MTSRDQQRFEVNGRVVDKNGAGVAHLKIRAFDHDPGKAPQRLGEIDTGADGRFLISFPASAAGGASEGAPEFFVLVHNRAGMLVHSGVPITLAAARHDLADIVAHARTIDPASQDLAEADSEIGPADATSAQDTVPGGTGTGAAPLPLDPASSVGDNRIHGSKTRDFVVPRSPFYHGPFGRLFRQLPAWVPQGASEAAKIANIRTIADLMIEPVGPPDATSGDNKKVPVGYTYFGQFVDHDITFDPASSLAKQNDPDRLENFRTPRFDLDNLYGEGPDDEPFMYDQRPDHRGEFLVGNVDGATELDLPRNRQGTALIGDPRNDENIVVAQMQLAFMLFHNAVLKRVVADGKASGRDAFHRAQNLVRWHYQHVVMFDYLPRICGPVASDVIKRPNPDAGLARHQFNLRFYKYKNAPFMPVEFSAAAYRFGHSQIRQQYDLNSLVRGVPIFLPPETNPGPLSDLRGFRPLPRFWTIDWRRFFATDKVNVPQFSRLVDTKLSRALTSIPAGSDPKRGLSLGFMNLLRGFRLGLPSGQAVARAMSIEPISNKDLDLDVAIAGSEAPLWFYVLKESERQENRGEHLGPVGARIVAETFAGLVKADPNSYFNVDPSWTPATAMDGKPLVDTADGELKLADIFRFAGLGGDPMVRQ